MSVRGLMDWMGVTGVYVVVSSVNQYPPSSLWTCAEINWLTSSNSGTPVVFGFILVPDIASCICFQAGIWGPEPSIDTHHGFLAAHDGFLSHCLVLVAHVLEMRVTSHWAWKNIQAMHSPSREIFKHGFTGLFIACRGPPSNAVTTFSEPLALLLLASMRDYCCQALGHHNDKSYSPSYSMSHFQVLSGVVSSHDMG